MGWTIAGNTHEGTVYKKVQYVWASGLGGANKEVELFEEDGFFVYQFNPQYAQRDDGILAVEFYYYYHKPDSQAFWDYVYYAENYYIVPFIAWYYDEGDVGHFGTILSDAPKISLVGRDSGWIHVTLYMDEVICENDSLYFGIYSPLLNFCYDTSVTDAGPIVPYQLEFDYEDEEDYEVYDFLKGGELEDYYWRRTQQSMYPSFYIKFRDVTPESFAYSVNEEEIINVTSTIERKAFMKMLLSEIESITEWNSKASDLKRCIEVMPDIKSKLVRKHEAFRDLYEGINIAIMPFASRFFYRACQSVMSFCVWLRVKIREANNVITLFCPIHIEITMECKI